MYTKGGKKLTKKKIWNICSS